MPTYDGLDILDVSASDGAPRVDAVTRDQRTVGPYLGTYRVDVLNTFGVAARGLRWICTTRGEVALLRAFLDARKGRAVPFWLPSHEHDLTVTESPASSATLKVLACGYASELFPLGGWRRHIAILKDGVYYGRKVTAAVDQGDGTEWLTLSSAFGSEPAGIHPCMYLRKCRLAVDVIDLTWTGSVYSVADIPIVEVPQEAAA